MFTVCPKCALTLVVTAQDLRVAQGYVRCGRCSNVFNAIVGLTDDRGALANSGSQATATTSIIRKAPSISDDEPAAQDGLGDTGESEAIYAEPDEHEMKFQEVFAEPTPPTRSPARTPPPAPSPSAETRATGPISFVAPPPGPTAKAPATSTQTKKALDAQRRYSDTEGIDTYPESELEFNPDVTDVTKVFVEAAPVTFKGDATGKFRKFVMGEEQPAETEAPAPGARSSANGAANPAASGAKSPGASAQAQADAKFSGAGAQAQADAKFSGAGTQAQGGAKSSVPGAQTQAGAKPSAAGAQAQGGAKSSSPSAPQAQAGPKSSGADAQTQTAANSGGANGTVSGATPPGSARSAPSQASPARTPTSPPPPRAPERDEEDFEFDSELRSLAARLDLTSNRPAPKFPAAAANDEAVEANLSDEGSGLGDIYAKAVPRPRPPPPPKPVAPAARAEAYTSVEDNDFAADAEMQAVDSAIETFTPAAPPRSRFMWWVAGAAVLSVLLAGQAIHHNRHSLATNALLNRPLTKFYKAIGVPLVPSWDLRSYDVRQLGASTNENGEGTLTVRASLKNDSSQPLPLPLLRITMQDRYGNRIATRDVPPSGYVPGALPAEAHLGVGQRIDAEMTFKDPGQNAVGFEIDACLAQASGRVACANDQAPVLR